MFLAVVAKGKIMILKHAAKSLHLMKCSAEWIVIRHINTFSGYFCPTNFKASSFRVLHFFKPIFSRSRDAIRGYRRPLKPFAPPPTGGAEVKKVNEGCGRGFVPVGFHGSTASTHSVQIQIDFADSRAPFTPGFNVQSDHGLGIDTCY